MTDGRYAHLALLTLLAVRLREKDFFLIDWFSFSSYPLSHIYLFNLFVFVRVNVRTLYALIISCKCSVFTSQQIIENLKKSRPSRSRAVEIGPCSNVKTYEPSLTRAVDTLGLGLYDACSQHVLYGLNVVFLFFVFQKRSSTVCVCVCVCVCVSVCVILWGSSSTMCCADSIAICRD